MGFKRILAGCLLILVSATGAWSAAITPAADIAPGKNKRQTQPAGELRAVVVHETFEMPSHVVEPPNSSLSLNGQGICIYYLIPYERVKGILPAELAPYPGPEQIWFRVDFINWQTVTTKGDVKQNRFVEMAYRFEVKRGGERGTYPIKIYADEQWAVLWMRQKEQYPAFQIKPADVNYSPFIHFFQVRKGMFALAVIEAKSRQGFGAQMNDIFGRREDVALWEGGKKDFIFSDNRQGPRNILRTLEVDLKAAEIQLLVLPEPKQWKILSEEETSRPDKVLLLESIRGTWAEPSASTR